MRISDWSSDVCSSDLKFRAARNDLRDGTYPERRTQLCRARGGFINRRLKLASGVILSLRAESAIRSSEFLDGPRSSTDYRRQLCKHYGYWRIRASGRHSQDVASRTPPTSNRHGPLITPT